MIEQYQKTLDLLKSTEWAGDRQSTFRTCPACKGPEFRGHRENCNQAERIAYYTKAIAELRSAPTSNSYRILDVKEIEPGLSIFSTQKQRERARDVLRELLQQYPRLIEQANKEEG